MCGGITETGFSYTVPHCTTCCRLSCDSSGPPNVVSSRISRARYLLKLITASCRIGCQHNTTMLQEKQERVPHPLTRLFEPYASLCPLMSQQRQCSSSSSESDVPFGLSQPGCGGRFQLARGIEWLSTFHISTWRDVAPAMNAPSGVKASRTMGESIVKKHFALLSGLRAFQIRIAQSSPPVAISRSSSCTACVGGNGCQAIVVMAPWCAEMDRRCPDSSQSCALARQHPPHVWSHGWLMRTRFVAASTYIESTPVT